MDRGSGACFWNLREKRVRPFVWLFIKRWPWLEWDQALHDTALRKAFAELASPACGTVARALAVLPGENKAFPDSFRINARLLLKLCGFEVPNGDPSRAFKVEESRVARGEKRDTSLNPDLDKRFGTWARFGEHPVKLSPRT